MFVSVSNFLSFDTLFHLIVPPQGLLDGVECVFSHPELFVFLGSANDPGH